MKFHPVSPEPSTTGVEVEDLFEDFFDDDLFHYDNGGPDSADAAPPSSPERYQRTASLPATPTCSSAMAVAVDDFSSDHRSAPVQQTWSRGRPPRTRSNNSLRRPQPSAPLPATTLGRQQQQNDDSTSSNESKIKEMKVYNPVDETFEDWPQHGSVHGRHFDNSDGDDYSK